jgi:hypothetical protein
MWTSKGMVAMAGVCAKQTWMTGMQRGAGGPAEEGKNALKESKGLGRDARGFYVPFVEAS